MKISRILMNEADASPGGGGVAPQTPAEPAAQPGQGPEVVTLDQIKSLVTAAITESQNGIFANLRKAGVFKPDKPTPTTPAAAAAVVDEPTEQRTTIKSLQATIDDMQTRQRFERGARKHRFDDALDEDAYQLYKTQKPEDDAAWFAGKSKIFAVKESTSVTTTAQQLPATNPQGPQPAPISDKGSPAPGGVLDFEREIAENPLNPSKAALGRWYAKHGEIEGRRRLLELARPFAERIKVTR